MVLLAFRWLLTSALYYAALMYAAYVAFRPGASACVGPSSPGRCGKETLKLWMTLGTVTAFSDTLGFGVLSWVPLFYELRCVFVWTLILMDPKAWAHFYDVVLSPSASWLLAQGHELKCCGPVQRCVLVLTTTLLSLFIVVLEVTVSTGAVPKDFHAVEDMLAWSERLGASVRSKRIVGDAVPDGVAKKSTALDDSVSSNSASNVWYTD